MRPTFLPSLCADRRGTSTIELAFIVPILVLLTFVAADIALGFKAKIKLQAAAERTAQMAMSGGLNSSAYDNLVTDAAQGAGVSAANVTVTKTLLCNGVASINSECSTGEQIMRYVGITITGNYMPMFAKFMPNSLWASTQGITITGAASVRMQ